MLKKYNTLDRQAARNCIYEHGGLGDSAKVWLKNEFNFSLSFSFFFYIVLYAL